MGRPLYEIPKPHYDVRRVRLTKEERIIYRYANRRAFIIAADIQKRR